ncbi:MAG: sugar ABC transporter ATP-binding protein [Caldisericia bacterium]|nr:sugar ABC transporter ATP-binding protein [Caldisericia bacterium]
MKNNEEVVVKLSGICKKFGATQAIKDVDFELKAQEIHGLVGENGAGKTTLISILHGVVKKDSGSIIINGNNYPYMNTSIAKKVGIAVIPQKIQLFPELSIAENLFINNWTRNKKTSLINWQKMKILSRELLEKVELYINPSKKVGGLSYIEQQLIEITRVFFIENAKIIILDEPTNALVTHEADILFDFIRSLKNKGVSFIYITHYLDEIFKICDKVTVIRDGRVVRVDDVKLIDMNKLVESMVGEGIDLYPKRESNIGETILEVRNFIRTPIIKNVNFSLRKGEILGIAGLKGSGRTELARSICGLDSHNKGEIIYKGKKVSINNLREALNMGIGYLTEDRIKWGIFPIRSVRDNITITFLKNIINKLGIIRIKKEERVVGNLVNELNIKISSVNQPVNYLSGGNQQKVIVAKLLGCNLNILIFDEPTFGIDVKAKMHIHEIMNMLVKKGKSIILISSDTLELINVSDRILVLKNGEIENELLKKDFNKIKIHNFL